MTKWKKEYGDIVGLQLGSYNILMLSGVRTLKEASHNVAFNTRANTVPMLVFAGGSDHGKAQISR